MSLILGFLRWKRARAQIVVKSWGMEEGIKLMGRLQPKCEIEDQLLGVVKSCGFVADKTDDSREGPGNAPTGLKNAS